MSSRSDRVLALACSSRRRSRWPSRVGVLGRHVVGRFAAVDQAGRLPCRRQKAVVVFCRHPQGHGQAAPAVVVAGLAAVFHPAAGVGQGLLQGGPGGVVVFGLQGQVSGVDDLVPGYGRLRAAGAAGRTRRQAVFRRVHTVLGRRRGFGHCRTGRRAASHPAHGADAGAGGAHRRHHLAAHNGYRRAGRDARRPPPPMGETDCPALLGRGGAFGMLMGFWGVRLHGQQTGFQLIGSVKLVYFHLIFKPFHPRSPPPAWYVEGPAPGAAS